MEHNEAVDFIFEMRKMERNFLRGCKQLVLLNNEVRTITRRYERAVVVDSKTRRYNLRLRIMTIEGVRNMFHEYCQERADLLDDMEAELKAKFDLDWVNVQ